MSCCQKPQPFSVLTLNSKIAKTLQSTAVLRHKQVVAVLCVVHHLLIAERGQIKRKVVITQFCWVIVKVRDLPAPDHVVKRNSYNRIHRYCCKQYLRITFRVDTSIKRKASSRLVEAFTLPPVIVSGKLTRQLTANCDRLVPRRLGVLLPTDA